jgi:hypothetical protein
MKHLLLSLVVLALVSCQSPTKTSLEAMHAHWAALEPYTLEGIKVAPDISQEAKDELAHECDRFMALIEEELKYAE